MYLMNAILSFQVDTNKNGKLDMSEAMAAFEKIKSLVSSGSAK